MGGMTIVYLVIGLAAIGLLKLLIRAIVSSAKPRQDKNLILAARRGDNAQVEKLIAAGAQLEAKDVDGATALHAAANQDHVETVSLLVRLGANVNTRNHHGFRPLDDQVWYYHNAEMAGTLIENGASLDGTYQWQDVLGMPEGSPTSMLEMLQGMASSKNDPNRDFAAQVLKHIPTDKALSLGHRPEAKPEQPIDVSAAAAALDEMADVGQSPAEQAEEKLAVTCPNPECGRTLRAPAKYAGRRARCPACKQFIQIPDMK